MEEYVKEKWEVKEKTRVEGRESRAQRMRRMRLIGVGRRKY